MYDCLALNFSGLIPLVRFWQLAIKTASPTSQRHFIASFTAYLDSAVREAAYRENDTIRTIDSYIQCRRDGVGAKPSFGILELELDLPDEVFYHPVIVELSDHIIDMIFINDVSSIFISAV